MSGRCEPIQDLKKIKMSIRTLRIPIFSIVDAEKKDFYNDLRNTLNISRLVYNRVLTRCSAMDTDSYDSFVKKEKINNKIKFYTYPQESYNFPGCASECSSICRDAEKTYKQYRWDIICGRKSLPTKRSAPWPLLIKTKNYKVCPSCNNKNPMTPKCHKCQQELKGVKSVFEKRQGFDVLIEDDKVYCVINLLDKTNNNKKYKCELKSGSNYARLINTIKRELQTNPECIRDSSIWIDNRGIAVVGICVDVTPKQNIKSGTLIVKSDRECFFTCIKEQSTTPFNFNYDNLNRWNLERQRKQQRLRQDKKYTKKRHYITKLQNQISQKYQNKLKNFCHEISSVLVDYANRNRIAKLELDTTIKSYVGADFPWFDLETKIKYKCEDNGIEFEKITSDIIPPNLEEEPHVYFLLAIDSQTNKSLDKIKIGYTSQKKNKRQKQIDAMGGQDTIYLSAQKCPETKLVKLEKQYHAQFNDYCLDRKKYKEWFQAKPIIGWMREVGCLGNLGNLSQITQVIDV